MRGRSESGGVTGVEESEFDSVGVPHLDRILGGGLRNGPRSW